MAKTVYNITEAAVELGMSQDRVRALCASGDFGFKDGRQWFISHESLVAWVKRRDAEQCVVVGRGSGAV
ncbi:MAG: helix-turn-helix domain-containing protein [Propionibacteriaceae bacterium]|jgi:hypothetical protein|nr:helix-turn-helix domain-containing protein [Propionibacteriaceae bacterium]